MGTGNDRQGWFLESCFTVRNLHDIGRRTLGPHPPAVF